MFRHVTTRFAGLLILIAGVWGGLIPFLGPVFHFTLGPDHAWRWTTGRLWLSVLPAAAAVLGGLILMGKGPRLSGRFGALLALAGGIWFAAGPDVSMLWNHGVSQAGVPHGAHTITRMLEFLTLHSGIGVLITALAAYSLPGVAVYRTGRRRVAEDAAIAGTGAAAGAAETRHRDRVAEREAAPVAATGASAGAAETRHHDRVAEDAAIAGTGAAAGAAETRHHDRVAEREAAPVAATEAREPVDREPMTREAVDREPMTAQPGNGAATDQAANGAGTDQPANGEATAGPATATRRRGGIAGLFSRR